MGVHPTAQQAVLAQQLDLPEASPQLLAQRLSVAERELAACCEANADLR